MSNLAEGRPPRRLRGVLRKVGIGLGVAVLLLAVLVVSVGYRLSGPAYHGPVSDHFDGKRFFNRPGAPRAGFFGFLKWQWTREPGPWSDRPPPASPPPPARVGRGDLRVTFVNHATVLVQMDGANILTDPIWAERASPFTFVGPRRKHAPGVRFEDLAPIDVVTISHAHYDHLDLATLKRLAAAHHPQFYVGLGVAAILRREGIGPVTELDWWQGQVLSGQAADVRLTAVPAQHFSNRGLFDQDVTLWVGYVLQGSAGVTYVAGDTGNGPHFAEIRQRFGPPRLAILPIGAYRPIWFMGPIHISPRDAVAAWHVLGAGTALGMHFGTFPLADDGQDEPAHDLRAALTAAGQPDTAASRFWTLAPGEGRAVPALEPPR